MAMTHRLQVLIPEPLDEKISYAAEQERVTKGEWVRRAIERALTEKPSKGKRRTDPLAALSRLDAPTGDIEDMLAETEAGRW